MEKNNTLDDTEIKRLITESKIFFEHVDVGYFDGIKELKERTIQGLREKGLLKRYKKYDYEELNVPMAYGENEFQSVEIPYRKYKKPLTTPQETFQIVEDFFGTLGKKYENMAHNQLKLSKVCITDRALSDDDYKHRYTDSYENILLEDASNFLLVSEGNYLDVIVDVHEITHKFTDFFSKGNIDEKRTVSTRELNKIIKNSDSSFINEICFSETTAMLAELFCADYIKKRFSNKEYEKWATSIRAYSLIYDGVDEGKESEWIKLIKSIDDSDDGISKVRTYLNSFTYYPTHANDPRFFVSSMCHKHSHDLGYFYAVYLKEKCDKNPECKLQVFEDCLQLNCYGQNYYEEQRALIERLGVPMIKDGKITMDEETIEELSSSFINFFDNMKTIKGKNTTSIKDVVLNTLEKGTSTEDVNKANDATKDVRESEFDRENL